MEVVAMYRASFPRKSRESAIASSVVSSVSRFENATQYRRQRLLLDLRKVALLLRL
jgi:hypothetical protein